MFAENSKIMTDINCDSLGYAYSQEIRPYIELIDKLRKEGLQQDIDLPKVVVLGDQSSGKSSILEAISGVQLPRGKNIVTRCPLELQLKRIKDKPWNSTLSYRNKKRTEINIPIKDPSETELLIRKAQEDICGSKTTVSRELIFLRVESPSEMAPELTLIDLPGIARTNLCDQPEDIYEQIMDIIMDHIKKENTLIICVIVANLDATVNEAIKIARKVDKNGIRTIGVITKPDIARDNENEDALALLNNEKIKLVKGFNMVKCRSQTDLDNNISLKKSLENEIEFFKTNKFYKTINPSQLGTMNLATKITTELVAIIKNTLPVLRQNIYDLLKEAKEKLYKLPLPLPDETVDKQIYFMGILVNMNEEIKQCLKEGKSRNSKICIFSDWRKYFNEFKCQIEEILSKDIIDEFSICNLKNLISQQRSHEISGFLNYELFQKLMRAHVSKYQEKAEELLENVSIRTANELYIILDKYFSNFPTLKENLKEIVYERMRSSKIKGLKRINRIFIQEKIVFTMDNLFESHLKILLSEQNSSTQQTNLFHQQINTEKFIGTNEESLHILIKSYLRIVQARLIDSIPMTIRQCLHIDVYPILKENIIKFTISTKNIESVVEISNDIEERRQLEDKIKRLELANDEILQFDHSNVYGVEKRLQI